MYHFSWVCTFNIHPEVSTVWPTTSHWRSRLWTMLSGAHWQPPHAFVCSVAVLRITDAEAVAMSRYLVKNDGFFLGSSSACNLMACVKLVKQKGWTRCGKTIVTVLWENNHSFRFRTDSIGGVILVLGIIQRYEILVLTMFPQLLMVSNLTTVLVTISFCSLSSAQNWGTYARNNELLEKVNIPVDLHLVEDLLQSSPRLWESHPLLAFCASCITFILSKGPWLHNNRAFYSCVTINPSSASPIATRKPAQRQSTRAAPFAHANTRVEA